jgi:hypothetical protein
MKIDRYTKTVLTVIALSLVWISAQEIAWPGAVAAQVPAPSAVTVAGFAPNAIQQLTAFNPDGQGEARGIPVIVMNELKLKPQANPRRCAWMFIAASEQPTLGANWQQMSREGWELKGLSASSYVFEKCEVQVR